MARKDLLALPPRKAFPVSVEQAVMNRTQGRCACCGGLAASFSTKMRTKRKAVGWVRMKGSVLDHTPPLAIRDTSTGDYVPHQHSVEHLQLLDKDCNAKKTSKGVGTQRSDASMIAKIRRVKARELGVERPKAKIAGRPFGKTQKKFQSRSNFSTR